MPVSFSGMRVFDKGSNRCVDGDLGFRLGLRGNGRPIKRLGAQQGGGHRFPIAQTTDLQAKAYGGFSPARLNFHRLKFMNSGSR
jgi:hypothetical protein